MALVINKSAVIAASEKIDKLLSDRKASEAKAAEALAADETAIQKAEADMKQAASANDLEAYQKAKRALRDAKDSQELHGSWSKSVTEAPVITAEEYKSMVSAIYAEMDALENETLKKAVKLADDMAALGDALEEAYVSANKVLRRLQHDAYKDADRMRNPKTGEPMFMHHEDKAVYKDNTVKFTRAAKNHFMYEAYMKRNS